MNYKNVQCERIPLLVRRGGCGMNKKPRSHRSAADGVVAHTQIFQDALPNVTGERPPRPRLFGTGPFLRGAATPPHEEGNEPACNSFTASCALGQSLTPLRGAFTSRAPECHKPSGRQHPQ